MLCFLVVAFVMRRIVSLWRRDGASLSELTLSVRWMVPAVAFYIAGWLPSVWFWRRLMMTMGGPIRFRDTARAYFCGHLGKYIPGKATVVLIRAGLLKERGYRAAPAALAVAYETLAMMGSGVAVAVALSPLLLTAERIATFPEWLQPMFLKSWLPVGMVLLATAITLPAIAVLFTRIAVRMTPAEMIAAGETPRIGVGLLAVGLISFVISWALHGLSLGCTLRAVGMSEIGWSEWPVWTGAVSFATSIGFAALFAPGGVGVREGLLIEVLKNQPGMTAAQAVAATLLLRVLWLLAEIVTAAGLYYGIRPASRSVDAGTRGEPRG